jgi:hypothetical protein
MKNLKTEDKSALTRAVLSTPGMMKILWDNKEGALENCQNLWEFNEEQWKNLCTTLSL